MGGFVRVVRVIEMLRLIRLITVIRAMRVIGDLGPEKEVMVGLCLGCTTHTHTDTHANKL